MTSAPRADENDAENASEAAVEPDPEKIPTSTGETQEEAEQRTARLEEVEQRTAKVMADARKQVDRARETLHDQILSESPGGEEVDSEAEPSAPDKDDTRGAWPNGS